MTTQEAREGLAQMLLSLTDVEKMFKKTIYAEHFQTFCDAHADFLSELEETYQQLFDETEKAAFIKEIADAPAAAACDHIRGLGKSKQQMQQMQYNLGMVTFVNTALLKHPGTIGDPLVDEIVAAWGRTFPKNKIKKADYETIDNGFKTRKFCYITTAVCTSLGKGDDCNELMMLRSYRDTYLDMTPEGQKLVKDYYDLAPTIVNRIDSKPDAAEIYRDIYDVYLSPCLHLIRTGDLAGCRDRYRTMVYDLYRKFVIS